MKYFNSIRAIERNLSANTILVSEATMALLALLRSHKSSTSFSPSADDSFYAEAEDALRKELLGYEKTEWDLSTGFRCCNFRTAKIVDDRICYVPNPFPDISFHMLWGSRQVESLLSEVMTLTVLKCGNEKVIQDAAGMLERDNPLFHTETGFANVWAVFNGAELLRLYSQLRIAIIGVCASLCAHEESIESMVAAPPIQFNVPMPF